PTYIGLQLLVTAVKLVGHHDTRSYMSTGISFLSVIQRSFKWDARHHDVKKGLGQGKRGGSGLSGDCRGLTMSTQSRGHGMLPLTSQPAAFNYFPPCGATYTIHE